MAALPAPRPLPPPSGAAQPPADPPERPHGRRLSARTRYVLALEAADTARAELGAAALEGRPVQELAELLARVARLEAQVSVADRRNALVVKLATAAGRYVR